MESGPDSLHWTAKGHKQSWVKLLTIAAKYMWPEETGLQVGTGMMFEGLRMCKEESWDVNIQHGCVLVSVLYYHFGGYR